MLRSALETVSSGLLSRKGMRRDRGEQKGDEGKRKDGEEGHGREGGIAPCFRRVD